MAGELTAWVRSELSSLLGESDETLSAFVIALSASAASPAALLAKLADADVDASAPAARRFAAELFRRTPRRGAAAAAARPAAAPSQAELLRASKSYALVREDLPPPAAPAPAAVPAAAGARGHLRKRERGGSSEEEAEPAAAAAAGAVPHAKRGRSDGRAGGAIFASSAAGRASGAADGGDVAAIAPAAAAAAAPVDDVEAERARDAAERDAFALRLVERDAARTAAAGEGGGGRRPRGGQALTAEEQLELVPELRKASRQQYIGKRTERELRLLEDSIRYDEGLLAAGEVFSAAERRRLEGNRELLRLARQKEDMDAEEAGGDRYRMPDALEAADGLVDKARRDALLTARAGTGGGRGGEPASEQATWEASRLAAAGGRGGGAAAATSSRVVKRREKGRDGRWVEVDVVVEEENLAARKYDLVLEGGAGIDFVSDAVLKGLTEPAPAPAGAGAGGRGGGGGAPLVITGATAADADVERRLLQQLMEEAERAKAGARAAADGGGGGGASSTGGGGAAARAKMAAVRASLPIAAYRTEFLEAVAAHQVIVLVGETGSGKTTQLTQYLHEVGYSKLGRIGCTQPRRVAAMSVAARVAEEVGVKLGAEVGYSIRFEDCTSPSTVIKYMTDGMLLREFLTEPDLRSYAALVIDEAHERTLHTDILFGLVKDIARFRPDIKIVISSATMDAEKFSAYFDDAPIFEIPGRRFAVGTYHTKAPEADYVLASVVTTLQIHVTQPLPGDILVFLTGQEEIEEAAELLAQRCRALGGRVRELLVLPIYAALPAEAQARIFEPTPPGSRKVIIATNIAETSLTIEGIVYVIDCGYCKQNSYNPRTGIESLQVVPISRASAVQRAGRAGRTQPGKCFRLYTAWSFANDLPGETTPEIQRTNLASVVLMLKSLGIDDLLHFDFLDKPPNEALIRALEQLYALGALNDRGALTKLGRRMAEFPSDPMLSKMILAAERYGCVDEVLSIAAMLDVQASVFFRPKDRALHADAARANFARGGSGDHATLLAVYSQWRDAGDSAQWCAENFVQARSMKRARDVRAQLEALCERVELRLSSAPGDADAVGKAVTAGYFYHAAKLQRNGAFRTVKTGHTVHIHPSSCLAKEDVPPKWLVFHELVETSKEFMRQVSAIKPEWLTEIAPHMYSVRDTQGEVRRGHGEGGASARRRGERAAPRAALAALAALTLTRPRIFLPATPRRRAAPARARARAGDERSGGELGPP
jgi:pre-mRNA-splicing factor ATP-dependent RNA helicase DHX16